MTTSEVLRRARKRVATTLCLMALAGAVHLASAEYDHTQLLRDVAAGNPEARYTYAHLLLKGRGGVARDREAGLRWLELAAADGHREAAYELGVRAVNDRRVDKALAWLRQAAEAGHTNGQYALGITLMSTQPEEALDWLRQAAEAGHTDASTERARLCAKNPDVCRPAE